MATDSARIYPSELPTLALRETIVFPLTLQPLAISRPHSIEAVNRALAQDRLLFLTLQNGEMDDPQPSDLRDLGTIAVIRQMAKMPNGGIHVIVEGLQRGRADLITRTANSLRAMVRPAPEEAERTLEVDAYIRRLQELIDKALSAGNGLSQELRTMVAGIDDQLRLSYLLSSLLDMKADEKQQILETDKLLDKLRSVESALNRELSLLELKGKIESAAQQEMTDAQRQYLPAAAAEGHSGGAWRRRKARGTGPARADRGRNTARACEHGRPEGSRAARADDAGVARVPDDPHLP